MCFTIGNRQCDSNNRRVIEFYLFYSSKVRIADIHETAYQMANDYKSFNKRNKMLHS